MRILVYGAGPMGSYFAAKLGDSDQDVTILARERRLSTLSRYLIVLENQDGVETARVKVPVLVRLSPVDAYDLVLVAVGKNHYPGVLPFLAANISTPNVLFLGNNVEGPREMVRLLGQERVLLGFPGVSGMVDSRVVRYSIDERPSLTFGELDGSESERTAWIKDLFEGAGFDVNVSSNMESILRYHAALILPLMGAFVRAEWDRKRLEQDGEGLVLMLKAMREGIGALKELGLPIVLDNLGRIEWVPAPVMGIYARRMLGRRDLEYIFTRGPTALGEMKMLTEEFRKVLGSTSKPTPCFDELSEYIRKG
ncbi:MAG: hypothetical protein JSV27_05970 [Candidatus Bathyarchaeota archaeon]|nr:MAG: hypothetical protein JSV27_05970 [Candidatus Bathyarchaeota archaeon]